MEEARFHFIAKFRATTFNPVLADRGLSFTDSHNIIDFTADCQSQQSKFESGLPKGWTAAGFVLSRRARVGNPQYIWKLSAKQLLLYCQIVELERGS
jgi:hypothetical protein